jgi:CheY-like chemotaxis protein
VADPKIIAVFNSNSEVLDLVRESLQVAGYATVVAHIDDLKRGRIDMIQFIDEHKPDVIVYDIGPPYDTNWTFLRLMRNSKVITICSRSSTPAFPRWRSRWPRSPRSRGRRLSVSFTCPSSAR